MKKLLFTLTAATLLTASFALPAFAAPKGNQGSPTKSANHTVAKSNGGSQNKISNNMGKGSNYHLTNAVKFDHGFFYRGRDHNHWTSQRFDSRYGCTCYFDGGLSTWFYFCAVDVCYYPVSYVPNGYCSTCAVPVMPCQFGCSNTVGFGYSRGLFSGYPGGRNYGGSGHGPVLHPLTRR
jgi:hypothetical protein